MKLTDSPTELTTALTDVVVFIVAAVAIVAMMRAGSVESWKMGIWGFAFGFISLAALLGACVHGIELTDAAHQLLWHVLNLFLGLAVSLFAVGVILDLSGMAAARRFLPIMIAAGAVFFTITRRYPGVFFVFIVYEAGVLLFALTAYCWLTFREGSPGAPWMAAGVLVSMVAAAIQSIPTIRVKALWSFDHNGVFHIVQAFGLILLARGITF